MRLFFLFFLFQCSLINGQTKIEVKILNRIIEDSFSPVQDFLMKDSINNVQLKFIYEEDEIISLIRSKILSSIKEDSSSKDILEIIVNNFKTEYPSIVSFPLFGEEKLRRDLEVDITYNLISNGKVKFHHNYNYVQTDTIPISSIISRQDGSVINNSIPSVPFWRSLVEPAIISSITGLIVYLFFTVRSR